MRVLVVTNLWPTPEAPGRGGFVKDQVDALSEIPGLEIEVFTFGIGSREYVRAAREIRRRYRETRFDVIHAQYGLCGWSAVAAGRTPDVVTFHGTDLAHRYVGPLSRALARLIRLPAPVSTTLARAGLPHARKPVAILPCGVNLDRFKPLDKAEARRRLGLERSGRYLLFPSDPRRPEKRHDRARELAAAVDAQLIAYGQRAPEEIPLMINAANAVLMTSEREGFGLAPLEALACDIPVLATEAGIAPLVLDGIRGAIAAPFDVATWSAKVAPHLASDDPRIAGRVRAELFDRRRLATRVFHAYNEVVDLN